MSHIVRAPIKLKNREHLRTAAEKLGCTIGAEGSYRIGGAQVQGLSIKLPGWTNPIVVTEAGEIGYDNWGGRWGSQEKLDELCQEYAITAAEVEAQLHNMSIAVTRDVKTGVAEVTMQKVKVSL